MPCLSGCRTYGLTLYTTYVSRCNENVLSRFSRTVWGVLSNCLCELRPCGWTIGMVWWNHAIIVPKHWFSQTIYQNKRIIRVIISKSASLRKTWVNYWNGLVVLSVCSRVHSLFVLKTPKCVIWRTVHACRRITRTCKSKLGAFRFLLELFLELSWWFPGPY